MKNLALEHFRRPPMMLNCAQSILYAYQNACGDPGISFEEMKRCGGGRAPGGLCGALHALCVLLPKNAEQLKESFAARTGSTKCQKLRESDSHICQSCVTEAAQLLETHLATTTEPKSADQPAIQE